MITIRRATLADREQIFGFIRHAYAEKWPYKIPERWEWEFRENPFLPDDRLPVWIALAPDGRVVGQTCALVEPLRLGATLGRVGWSVDTYVLPEFRGQGIGYRLQEANHEANDVFMSLSMSAANRRIKEALGSVAIEPVTEYIKTLRHGPDGALAAVLGPGSGDGYEWLFRAGRQLGLGRILARLLTLRTSIQDARRLRSSSEDIQISRVEEFDPEVDQLAERIGRRFRAMIVRDHRYLNWKFVRQPHVRYTRFVARRNGSLRGYVIGRKAEPPEPNIGILADLVCLPGDQMTLHALLAAALRQFLPTGVSIIRAATTVPEYATALEQFGFRKAGVIIPMFHCRSGQLDCRAALEPGSWLLSRGDHDWDQYPNA